MNHWLVVPLLVPALAGPLIVLAFRERLGAARAVSIVSSLALLAVAALLVGQAGTGAIHSYAMGDWPAPYGIILVLDRLSAGMLLLTAVLGLAVNAYAIASSLDAVGRHFHGLLQLQLLGLNGAFLTGDLFNLFVFFEVLLIASYCLMLHGGGRERVAAGVPYVVINLAASVVFLAAVGLLYGATGTLNMADMARRIATAPVEDHALLATGFLLLTAVFAVKGALAPLHLWLPRTYANTSPVVAALFVIMTKVGAYSILRTTTLMFGEGAGTLAWLPGPWLLPAALATGVLGYAGVFAASHLRPMAAFAVVGSMGVLFAGISAFQPAAITGALYYLASSTLAGASLFLIADMVSRHRAGGGDALRPAAGLAGSVGLAIAFMLVAVAVVGLPPLSGFIGKLMILTGVGLVGAGGWIWLMVLGTSFLALVAFARAGSALFWSPPPEGDEVPARIARPWTWPAAAGLIACLALLSAAAGPVTAYLEAASGQMFTPGDYVAAVLGPAP